jgi:hypothetical protein
MKLYNPKTRTGYIARTRAHGLVYKSIVERWVFEFRGAGLASISISSMQHHTTRTRAYRYACSMARAQFASHVALHGANHA